jgi:hypothetical protein
VAGGILLYVGKSVVVTRVREELGSRSLDVWVRTKRMSTSTAMTVHDGGGEGLTMASAMAIGAGNPSS